MQFAHAVSVPCIITDGKRGLNAPHIIAANDAFCDMCGYTQDELLGQSPKILQGIDTDIEDTRTFRDNLEESGQGLICLINYRKDGSAYEALVIGTRLNITNSNEMDHSAIYMTFSLHITEAPLCLPTPPKQWKN